MPLILASGCLWEDETAPVEVSAGLRSETMAAVLLVEAVSRPKVRVTRSEATCSSANNINTRSLVAGAIQSTPPRVTARAAGFNLPRDCTTAQVALKFVYALVGTLLVPTSA
jgi:hypothetical protein